MTDSVAFTVNGEPVKVEAHPMARLLDVVRQQLHLTGTKEGCGEGECGACTVLVGGEHPLQRAFAALGGAQCGICTPGMIMMAMKLPPNPTLDDVRTGLAGNLCRCTGYEAIYRAIQSV